MPDDEDRPFLRETARPILAASRQVRVVDLFAGCGGMSIGMWEAARREGIALDIPLAVDFDPVMAATFKRNFPEAGVVCAAVEALFPGEPGSELSETETRMSECVKDVNLLVGGPPCQGHSDLNNHTRRDDQRNDLYLKMARAAEILQPAVVVIENVPAVQWDEADVVGQTMKHLEKLGYIVEDSVVHLSRIGVPQTRKRHILLASRIDAVVPIAVFELLDQFSTPRTVSWAIRDLVPKRSTTVFDSASRPTKVNASRIDYLFDHDLYELPDQKRPNCHKNKVHSYKAVYGRMRWDQPAPTITTGFGCMGQGRFVHPQKRRTITPHEAARLQCFPDWFNWGADIRRGRLATMIGNAVPPLLMMRIGEALLPSLPLT